MNIPAPHFLLFSEAKGKKKQGQWRFVLQAADGSATLEAEELEPEVGGERLELLAVIRGLEALDQPSRVTLFTPSKYVSRGIAYGLEEWRRNDWTWECFGEMVPVKNRDLWQRLDRALNYHTIEFRVQRTDPAHAEPSGPIIPAEPCAPTRKDREIEREQDGASNHPPSRSLRRSLSPSLLAASIGRSLRERTESWKIRCGQLGTALLPNPWLE